MVLVTDLLDACIVRHDGILNLPLNRSPSFFRRPYNTVACDPSGRLVALGGWDSMIKVWDILTNKRQSVSGFLPLCLILEASMGSALLDRYNPSMYHPEPRNFKELGGGGWG